MPHFNLIVTIYAFIAGFIAWIWIDYYRLIEVYEKEDLKYILVAFFLGMFYKIGFLGRYRFYESYSLGTK